MRFHLLGGVTRQEAEAVEAQHGHKWQACCRRGCQEQIEAVMLFRGPSRQPGDVQGGPVCPIHETEMLALVQSSTGYLGAVVEEADGEA